MVLLIFLCAIMKPKVQLLVVKFARRFLMSLATQATKAQSSVKSQLNDEFQHYLKKQCLKTTFNGLELETFSWYKKVLGLV